MRRRLIRLLVVLLCGGSIWLWFHLAYPGFTCRYRLTVEVMDNGVLKTGSSVIEAGYQRQPKFDVGSWSTGARGEAVDVDLGARGHLFALLTLVGGQDQPDLPLVAFHITNTVGNLTVEQAAKLVTMRGSTVLPPNLYPIMVRFHDPSNRASMEALDVSNLASSLGAGVELKRVTMEFTDDAVTTGIAKALPWLTKPNANTGWRPQPIPGTKLDIIISGIDFMRGTQK